MGRWETRIVDRREDYYKRSAEHKATDTYDYLHRFSRGLSFIDSINHAKAFASPQGSFVFRMVS